MKRLVKKSKYEDFIQSWYNSWGSVSEQEINQVINENPQFAYSGQAWRWIGLQDLKSIILSNVNDESGHLEYNQIVDIVKPYVKNNSKYCSWCMTDGDAETYGEKVIEEYRDKTFGVIIEATIKGLQYRDFLLQYNPEMAEMAEEENEIIGRTDSFSIVALTIEQDGTMYLYNNSNPLGIDYNKDSITIN